MPDPTTEVRHAQEKIALAHVTTSHDFFVRRVIAFRNVDFLCIIRDGYEMALNAPELEQRLSNLQTQIVSLWQRTERNTPLEQRLSGMADDYAECLKQWANTVERHTCAVTQLEGYINEWKDASGRIREDSFHRLKELEVIIERELNTLRTIQEEPVKELREQAASLKEICAATAGAAQQELHRTERRLATFEGDFYGALSDFTRELRTAVAEIKAQREPPPAGVEGAGQWAFDDVNRLHQHLRDFESVERSTGMSLPPRDRATLSGSRQLVPLIEGHTQSRDARVRPEPPASDADRMPVGTVAGYEAPIPRKWRVVVICLGLALIAVGGLGWRLYTQVRLGADRAQRAALQSAAAAVLAENEAAKAREEAAREIAGARQMATQAQRVSSVLAAPDLVRYNLTGSSAVPRASGQALWSRSRGLVFSGTGIPAAPPNMHHQVWLLTRAAAVRAGSFSIEPDGTVTSLQSAPFVPRTVVGVMVTLEEASESEVPSADTVLTSVHPAQ
jgi:hypothetical protein